MKKIIALLTLFFAFTMNVAAQDNAKVAELAKKDVEALKTLTRITPQNEATFIALFSRKHEAYSQANLSDERKKIVAKSVDAKLRATLDADQMTKLEANPEVLKKLTQE